MHVDANKWKRKGRGRMTSEQANPGPQVGGNQLIQCTHKNRPTLYIVEGVTHLTSFCPEIQY